MNSRDKFDLLTEREWYRDADSSRPIHCRDDAVQINLNGHNVRYKRSIVSPSFIAHAYSRLSGQRPLEPTKKMHRWSHSSMRDSVTGYSEPEEPYSIPLHFV